VLRGGGAGYVWVGFGGQYSESLVGFLALLTSCFPGGQWMVVAMYVTQAESPSMFISDKLFGFLLIHCLLFLVVLFFSFLFSSVLLRFSSVFSVHPLE
jgi:hypothetical protein